MIPAELRERAQWVVWRDTGGSNGKPTKVPYRAHRPNLKASTTDPTTWAAFDVAEQVASTVESVAGVGFVFSADDPYVGIDLDAIVNADGRLVPLAAEILDGLNSYAEQSPSGWGVHVIVRGALTGTRRRARHTPWGGDFEVYDQARFFTMTSRRLPYSPATIEPRQAELDALCAWLLPPPAKTNGSTPLRPVDVDDGELLERMFAAINGPAILALWRGDTSGHGDDDSAADLALCSHLAFWTDADAGRVDDMFRHSGLMRPKWDERRGDTTYGALTVAKALTTTTRKDATVFEFDMAAALRNGKVEEQTVGKDASDHLAAGKTVEEFVPMEGVPSATSLGDGTLAPPALFGIRRADPSKMRPIEFVYEPWIVRGRGNEIVGEEDVGKSMFAAYAAKLTTGELPGVFDGRPRDVLFLGTDEDDWNGMTLPRLHAAGADLARVYELYTLDANAIFNSQDHGSELGRLLAHDFGLVVIEHVLDILPQLHNPNEPTAIRRALRPMLRVMALRETAALWTRHVNKAEARSFRQKAQGSAQFGAVARSSFLLAQHPKDATARLAILGKANYVKDKVSLTFTIAEHIFTANEYDFNVGRVVEVKEDSTTMDEALAGGPSDREVKRDALRGAIFKGVPSASSLEDGVWHPPPISTHAVAEAVGRSKTDGSVRRILTELEQDGLVRRVEDGWIRVNAGREES